MTDTNTATGTNAAAADAAASGQQQAAAATATSWRDGLPAEYRGHAAFANMSDLGALAKEHLNLQGLIGKKGVVMPGAGDAPEAWDRFYKDLGRPDAPEGYEFKKPEGGAYSDDLAKQFRAWSHKAGLSPRQAQALHDSYFAELTRLNAEAETAEKQQIEAATAKLRGEWGAAFDAKIALSERAIDLGGPELSKAIKASGIRNDPTFIAWVAKLGERLAEHKLIDGAANAAMTPAEAKAAIAKLDAEAIAGGNKHPAVDKLHPEHAAWNDKRRQLYEMAYSEPAR